MMAARPEPRLPPITPNAVAAWLADHGGARVDPAVLIAGLCERLLAAGVPLWRVSYGYPTLHPRLCGSQFDWRRDATCVADEGATDRVAMSLPFSSGRDGFVSWATDRACGFRPDERALLEGLLPLIALRLELEASYTLTNNLMETYLGRDAARRVLAGEVARGSGTRVRAAILLCDLRGFTAMSDRLPAETVIAHLDSYFDVVGRQVQRYHGEVLEFIGDGVLAAFDIDGGKRGAACCQALHAAIALLHRMAALNRGAAEPMNVVVALHLGEVVYGNIGAADRLDFTVIGPAVNEAARIEGLCKELDRTLLASASFAESCTCEPLVSLGRHALRGVAGLHEIFTLPPDRLPAPEVGLRG